MSTLTRWIVGLLCAVAAAAGGYYWWQTHQKEAPVAENAGSRPASQPQRPASVPAVAHPIEAASGAATLPDVAHSDELVRDALANLFGKFGALTFLQMDGFVRRAVASVDNLGREHAPSSAWPVQPMAERFVVDEQADGPYLAPANARRYEAFVAFVDGIDAAKAAALYKHLYPLFQAAYGELGFPGKYFNDRAVAVIDILLQAPEPDAPIKLSLTQVQGPIPSTRPWVRYQFADPALESLPAGQKILIRMGLANERTVKAKLTELRAQIAGRARGETS
jgi:hypothetical protein